MLTRRRASSTEKTFKLKKRPICVEIPNIGTNNNIDIRIGRPQ